MGVGTGVGNAAAPVQEWEVQEVEKMRGDGSCLFHALVDGRDGRISEAMAKQIRRRIVAVMLKNPQLEVAGASIAEWVRRDSGLSVEEYAARLAGGAWGGGIELAVYAATEKVEVRVFTPTEVHEKVRLVVAFGGQVDAAVVSVLLYGGGAHYDAVKVVGVAESGLAAERRRRTTMRGERGSVGGGGGVEGERCGRRGGGDVAAAVGALCCGGGGG